MPNDTLSDLVGSYAMTSSENFDEFMKAMGVGLIKRKLANSVSPSTEIIDNKDGTFTMKVVSKIKTSTFTFKLGEPTDEDRLDDQKVKSTVTREGNKIIKQQDANPPVTITYEVNGDEMIQHCICNGVTAVRKFKKQ